MKILVTLLITFVAIEHIIFGLVEMFAKPEIQSKAFDFAVEDLKNPAVNLALRNQGIYNLVFGLINFHMLSNGAGWQVFAGLMGFVVIVGIYGGATVTKKIYLVQALPALITLILLLIIH